MKVKVIYYISEKHVLFVVRKSVRYSYAVSPDAYYFGINNKIN